MMLSFLKNPPSLSAVEAQQSRDPAVRGAGVGTIDATAPHPAQPCLGQADGAPVTTAPPPLSASSSSSSPLPEEDSLYDSEDESAHAEAGIVRAHSVKKQKPMVSASMQELRTQAVINVFAMYANQSSIVEDHLLDHAMALLQDLVRTSGRGSVKHLQAERETILALLRELNPPGLAIVQKEEKKDKKEAWHTVGKKMRKNRAMMKELGDEEERQKLIIWKVPEGLSLDHLHAEIEKVTGEDRDDITSLHRIRTAEWQSRVEVFINRPEAYGKWKALLQEAFSARGWVVRSGRKFEQRQADRKWRGSTLPEFDVKDLRLWSWNAAGLTSTKVASLEYLDNKADVIAVQETWFFGTYEPLMADYVWQGCNTSRKNSGRAMGGTGFFVHQDIADFTRIVDRHDDRIAVLEFSNRLSKVFLFSCYAPNTDASADSRHAFFFRLSTLIQKWKAVGEVILLGDFNARLGNTSDVIGRYNEADTNDNGPLLENSLTDTGMVALNGRKFSFPRVPNVPEFTRCRHGRAGADQSVLDYVCVRRELLETTLFEVLEHALGSDHYIIQERFPAITLANKGRSPPSRPTKEKRPNFYSVIHDSAGARNTFVNACDEAFADWPQHVAALHAAHPDEPQTVADKLHLNLVSRIKTATATGVPHDTVNVGANGRVLSYYKWHDQEVVELKKQREQLRQELIRCGSAAFLEHQDPAMRESEYERILSLYKEKCKAVKATIKAKKQVVDGDRQMRLLEDEIFNPKRFWGSLKRLASSGPRSRQSGTIPMLVNPQTGVSATADDDIREAQRVAAAALYNEQGDTAKFDADFYDRQRQAYDELLLTVNEEAQDEKTWFNTPISAEEVQRSMSSLALGKAPDRDGIRGEFFRFAPESVQLALLDLFNHIFDSGFSPDGWDIGTISMLPKPESDLTQTSNYRGITVLSTVRKVLDRTINSRLVENVPICPEQAGFRKDHSCADQAFIKRALIDLYVRERKAVYVCYVDYTKAFDRVWRDLLAVKMHVQAGVKGKTLRTILAMLKQSKGEIRYKGKFSSLFDIKMGVAQGDIKSPELFSIFVNDLTEHLRQSGCEFAVDDETNLPCLLFADDTTLLADSEAGMRKLLDSLEVFCNKWRLEVNEIKTKIMIYGAEPTDPTPVFTYGGKIIEVVTMYKYLGIWFSTDMKNPWKVHYEKTVAKANKKAGEFDRLFRNKSLAVPFKIAVYKSMIRPVLEYGCEVWSPTDDQMARLEKIQLRCAKIILGTPTTTATVAVLTELGLRRLETRFHQLRLSYCLKLYNMDLDDSQKNRHASRIWRAMNTPSSPFHQQLKKSGWLGKTNKLRVLYPAFQPLVDAQIAKHNSENDKPLQDVLRTAVKSLVARRELTALQQETAARSKIRTVLPLVQPHLAEQEELDANAPVAEASLSSYFARHFALTSWKAQRFMFMLRAGNAPLGVELERFAGADRVPQKDQVCPICDSAGPDDQAHFLLDCKHSQMSATRAAFWHKLAAQLAAIKCKKGTEDLAAETAKMLRLLQAMPRDQQLRLFLADTRAHASDDPNSPLIISSDSDGAALLVPIIVNGAWDLFKIHSSVMQLRTQAAEEEEKKSVEEERQKKRELPSAGLGRGRPMAQSRVDALFASNPANRSNSTLPPSASSLPTPTHTHHPHVPEADPCVLSSSSAVSLRASSFLSSVFSGLPGSDSTPTMVQEDNV